MAQKNHGMVVYMNEKFDYISPDTFNLKPRYQVRNVDNLSA